MPLSGQSKSSRSRRPEATFRSPVSRAATSRNASSRWLLIEPKVLLLDEPTRGIDVGAKAEIYALIRKLASQGRAVIMTSSELPELLAVSDRIIVLCEGRITALIPRRRYRGGHHARRDRVS